MKRITRAELYACIPQKPMPPEFLRELYRNSGLPTPQHLQVPSEQGLERVRELRGRVEGTRGECKA